MAGQAQQRTVSVRMRSVLPWPCNSTVRRLFVVGGLAAAGWLLGSAGQAHADAAPQRITSVQSHTAAAPLPDGARCAESPGTTRACEQPARRSPVAVSSAAPAPLARFCDRKARSVPGGRCAWSPALDGMTPGARGAVGSIGGAARSAAGPVDNTLGQGVVQGIRDTQGGRPGPRAQYSSLPVRPGTMILELPMQLKEAAADLTSADVGCPSGRTASISWTRHRDGATAGIGDGTTVRSDVRTAQGPAVRTGRAGVLSGIRGGRGAYRSAFPHPAPGPGLPRPVTPEAGALPVQSGSVHQDGGFGALTASGTGPYARPAFVRTVLGAVPAAVRTAADEPSFSPD